MIGALVLSALVVLATGALIDLFPGPSRPVPRAVPYVAGMLGSGLVLAAGIASVLHPQATFSLGYTLGLGATSVRFDRLAGFFLTLTGGLAVCVSAAMLSWSHPAGRLEGRGTGAGFLLLLGSLVVVLIAGDAFSFLFGWESLTVSFYVLTGARRASGSDARASWATLGIGKLSGVTLLVGFLLLVSKSHSIELASFAHVRPGALHAAAFALVIIGFGAKVGMLPFQVWIPLGYPATEGPARAALAGVAANAGFYGLWRFLALLGRPPIWLVVGVLALGGITALVGVVFAAVQSGLSRSIAYSSVENAGLIVVGYGVALAGAATASTGLEAVGLLAATLQVLAHAVAKSGLFSSAAFLATDACTDDLELLRGAGRGHPVSGTVFGLSALTLAGLPPTIGFVSEWFLLEALLQQFRLHDLALRLAMAFAGALVALTAGVAAFAFVRLLGLCVLGRPERAPSGRPRDGGVLGRGGLVLLGASCLGLAAAAPWIVRYIALGLSPVVAHRATAAALKSPWVLQPVFANFSILSPSWLFVVMPVGFVAVGLFATLLSGGRLLRVRRVPAWRSATGGIDGPDRYSAFGFANSVRHVLANVLGHEHSAEAISAPASASPAAAPAVSTPVAPAGSSLTAAPAGESTEPHIEVTSRVVEPVEDYIYRPIGKGFLRLSSLAKRLQSGRLESYVAYMLVALVIMLAVVALLG